MLPGVELLLARPDAVVVAILHGWCVGWMAAAVAGAATAGAMPEHAMPSEIGRAQVMSELAELRRDPYRYG